MIELLLSIRMCEALGLSPVCKKDNLLETVSPCSQAFLKLTEIQLRLPPEYSA